MNNTGLYACLYWNDSGPNVMRGYLKDLLPHVRRLDKAGTPWRVEAFGYTEEEDE